MIVPSTVLIWPTYFFASKYEITVGSLGRSHLEGGGGGLTVNVNVVVRVNPPPVPVTVIVYEPVGVDGDVLMVKVLGNVGLPEVGLKIEVDPEGRPDAERLTT